MSQVGIFKERKIHELTLIFGKLGFLLVKPVYLRWIGIKWVFSAKSQAYCEYFIKSKLNVGVLASYEAITSKVMNCGFEMVKEGK